METTEGAAFSVATTMAVRRASEGLEPAGFATPGAEGAGTGTGAPAAAARETAQAQAEAKIRIRLVVIILVSHLLQAKPMGRGPGPLAREIPGQDIPHRASGDGPARHVEGGPHDGSHHLVQEPVRLQSHGEESRIGLGFGPKDLA